MMSPHPKRTKDESPTHSSTREVRRLQVWPRFHLQKVIKYIKQPRQSARLFGFFGRVGFYPVKCLPRRQFIVLWGEAYLTRVYPVKQLIV